jgi:hypothetical protein
VDKRRQVCSKLDAIIVQTFPFESGEVRFVCVGLQSGQLFAAPGSSKKNQTLVTSDSACETYKDRGQGSKTQP